MCEAMDVIVQKIENKGIRKGIQQGKLKTVVSMYRKGKLTVDEFAEELGMTVNQFLAEAGMN